MYFFGNTSTADRAAAPNNHLTNEQASSNQTSNCSTLPAPHNEALLRRDIQPVNKGIAVERHILLLALLLAQLNQIAAAAHHNQQAPQPAPIAPAA